MKNTNAFKKYFLGFALTAICLPANLVAETNAATVAPASKAIGSTLEATSSDWTYTIAPYVWTPAMSGTTGAKGYKVDSYMSMGDVLEDLELGAMLTGEARKGDFALTTDFIYSQLSDRSATPLGKVFSSARGTADEVIWTQKVAYTVVRDQETTLDLTAGFRLMYVSMDLDLAGAAAPSVSASGDDTWVDPVIGFNWNLPIGDQVSVTTVGDIGGFGSASDLTWQAALLLNYGFCEDLLGVIGYRALGDDYSHNGNEFDVVMYGPVIGMEFKF